MTAQELQIVAHKIVQEIFPQLVQVTPYTWDELETKIRSIIAEYDQPKAQAIVLPPAVPNYNDVVVKMHHLIYRVVAERKEQVDKEAKMYSDLLSIIDSLAPEQFDLEVTP